ncbi:sigma-54 interaction domain-containing protein [Pseudohongiella spirulinae]|uniref:Putative PAS/PAC sensor protein n=1 Tax=Pseudohongiella spirulinae TaxID=1249552 RepID=A0A0S2KGW0_9GAMM|nr:sigma-54-dependent Fis family transcriptional regulator [Pseudohongiella spirulinae]ALO47558.1 Putative PAS/PAC sensor protein [Pseudohongiella spirulinae]
MTLIATDVQTDLAAMLDGFDVPAILVSADYQILATNHHYRDSFGEIDYRQAPRCYRVSHGYDVPCDQAGESCPLNAARVSGAKERVLHIHQTPRGREHVDVEMLPIKAADGSLKYFVELLKPVPVASAEISTADMVGSSPAFNAMLENITRVGPTDASVLLLGESGTGKELAAMAIHRASARSQSAMVTLECSGLTETLFESELFGHVKGAFTGATFNSPGLVEAADGGTLFLDEIGDVPLDMQVKLLRLIETGTYRPVGSREIKRADFRLVCATHKDIFQMVCDGRFRQDLYYRINVFPIHMPSLHERSADIPVLANSILRKLDGTGRCLLTDSAIKVLQKHRYVGNIRELRNILARALVLANTHVIDGKVVRSCLAVDRRSVPESDDLPDLKTNESLYLDRVLTACQGDKEKAAAIAGISVRSLYRKLEMN